MALEITGRLIEVQPIQQIKENFSKREFVIEITQVTNTGMTFINYAAFQLVNNACQLIDRFQIGQDIKVSFDIRGNRWEKDGQVRYITNLNAWRVEPAMAAQPGYGAAPGYAAPQPGYGMPQQPAPGAMPPQYNNPAPQQAPPQPGFNPNEGGGDDLPF